MSHHIWHSLSNASPLRQKWFWRAVMWFDIFRDKQAPFVPKYGGLDACIQAGIDAKVLDRIHSQLTLNDALDLTERLYEAALRYGLNEKLFFTALIEENLEWITANAHAGMPRRCALVFTSPVRHSYYSQRLLPHVPMTVVELDCNEFVGALKNLDKAGIHDYVLDRCPCCWNFSPASIHDVRNREAALRAWAEIKAKALSEATATLRISNDWIEEDKLAESRDLLLYAIGHIAPDDARLHHQLGILGGKMADPQLQKQAAEALGRLEIPEALRHIASHAGLDLNH